MIPHRYLACAVFLAAQQWSAGMVAEDVSFRVSIAPLLLANCHGCHNQDTAESGYSVATFEDFLAAGDSDLPPVVAGKPDDSELLRRLCTDDSDERMPAESDPLSETAVALVRTWIQQGAAYDGKDKALPLSSILPVTRHPDAPSSYRFPIPITAMSFEDGDLLVGGYHEILRWNPEEKKILQRIPHVGERIYAIEVDTDAGRLFIGSGTPGKLGEVRIVDSKSGQLVGVPLVTNEVVLDVALHPTKALLAAAGADGKIHFVDIRNQRTVRSLDSHSDWVRAVAWNADGSKLASASRDKTAKVFDTDTGRPTATYTGHGEDIVDVHFVAGDNEKLVTCDAIGNAHLWSLKEDKKLKDFPTRGKHAFRMLPTKTGVWLASSDADVSEFSWDGEHKILSLGPHDQWVLSIAADDAEERVATGDLRGHVRIWNLNDLSLRNEFVALPLQQGQ